MPVPTKLGISFTPAEAAAMQAAAQVIIDTIESKRELNLSNAERKKLSKMGAKRMAYVQKSILELGPGYPQFNPLAYTLTDAQNDLATSLVLETILTKLTEASELAVEMKMVAGHFCYLFMRKQYEIAQVNKNENVTGAQVVVDELKAAFPSTKSKSKDKTNKQH